MAASNITIDDTSLLIEYTPAGAWDHASGSAAQAYTNDTFSRTSVEGATAKFSFEGTGFWLYGATQKEYGEYLLIVDGEVVKFANATSNDPKTMQVLGESTGLQDGKHEVVLMSAGRGSVDIDAIMYETNDQGQINATPNGVLTNAPSGATTTIATQSTSTTSSAKATGRLSAKPNAVGGPGDDPSSQVASSPSATGGGASPVAVGGRPAAIGGEPAVVGEQPAATTDAQPTATAAASLAQSETAPQSASTTASSIAPSISGQAERANGASVSQANRGLSLGAIIGISVGAVVSLLLLLGLVFLFLRRRRAKARRRQIVPPLMSPVLPLQDPDVENGPYFFGGPAREKYLAQEPAGRVETMSQPRSAGASIGGRASPYDGDLPPPGMPGARDSAYSAYTEVTLISEYSSSSKGPPTRPARPPDVRLSGL